jgi:lipoprotein
MRLNLKGKLLVSLLALSVLFGLSSCVLGETFVRPLDELSSTQPVTAEQFINSNSDEVHVYVLYKPSCPVCKKFGGDIVNELSVLPKEQYSVTNIADGIPEYYKTYFGEEVFKGIYTPYVIIARGTNILYSERIESVDSLASLRKSIISVME